MSVSSTINAYNYKTISANGNIKSEIAMRLKDFLCDRTRICFLAFVKVTYITRCYDIKSSNAEKVLKNLSDTQTKCYCFVF